MYPISNILPHAHSAVVGDTDKTQTNAPKTPKYVVFEVATLRGLHREVCGLHGEVCGLHGEVPTRGSIAQVKYNME